MPEGGEVSAASLLSPKSRQGCLKPEYSQCFSQPQSRAGAQGSRALEEVRAGAE